MTTMYMQSLQLAHSFFKETLKLFLWFLSFSRSWSEGLLSCEVRSVAPSGWAPQPGPGAFRHPRAPLDAERSVQDQKVRRLDPWNTAACRATQGEVAGLQNTLKKCCLIWRHHILGKMDEACGRTIRVGFLKLGKILKMAHAFGHKEK